MAVVELAGVTKRRGQVTALAPRDLRIEDGEFVAILGPSGRGKSTTLFLLAGSRWAAKAVSIGFEPASSLVFDTSSGKLIPGAEVRAA